MKGLAGYVVCSVNTLLLGFSRLLIQMKNEIILDIIRNGEVGKVFFIHYGGSTTVHLCAEL